MNQLANDNRAWVVKAIGERGLTEQLEGQAAAIFAAMLHPVWSQSYASAYSYGHNARQLGGKRLDHFASAYADICEEVGVALPLGEFWEAWDAGETFVGTAGEHWRVA